MGAAPPPSILCPPVPPIWCPPCIPPPLGPCAEPMVIPETTAAAALAANNMFVKPVLIGRLLALFGCLRNAQRAAKVHRSPIGQATNERKLTTSSRLKPLR